ncbi:MAG: hypothetical protein H0X28_15460 [Solirubrobacterales bacterium]|nr:hypothetical protein [Solirubrobacterales bacterium]
MISLAVLAAALLLPAAASASINWTGHSYHLNGGQSGYTNYKVTLQYSAVYSTEALGCAGIRYIEGVACMTVTHQYAAVKNPTRVVSEPYIHNHSTFPAYFEGFYE